MRSLGTKPGHGLAVVPPRPPQRRSLVPAVLAVMVLCGQIYLAAGRNFATILETPFLPYCLLGAFAIHFWTQPSAAERFATLGVGLAGALYFAFFSHRFAFNWASSVACASFFGLASLAVLAAQTVRRRGEAQKVTLDTLIAGSVFAYSALFIAYILNLTTRLHPRTFDLYLFAADSGFGVPFCAAIGQFVGARPWLVWWSSLVYESLPLAVSVLYAYQRSGSQRLPVRVLPAFLGGGAAAYVLYNVLPAAGPRYAFGPSFPSHLPSAAQAGLHLVSLGDVARNAVPSMHFACALLIFWTCRPLGRFVRALAALFLLFTVCATIGFGEHYVVDLVAAVPYALALAAICAPSGIARDWRAIALGSGLTLAWILSLRFATALFSSLAFTWVFTCGTIVASVFAWRRHKNIFALN